MTFDELNDKTGFANGDKFTSEQQVRDYFTVDNFETMFPESMGGTQFDADTLESWADLVIENGWHCDFDEDPADFTPEPISTITEVKIWWDDQDANSTGWCARSYDCNEQLEDFMFDTDVPQTATRDELVSQLPATWQQVGNIKIVR